MSTATRNATRNAGVNGLKKRAMLIMLAVAVVTGGCSSTSLWPDLSISADEADEALTKAEQSNLEELLSETQKNHRQDALKEIKNR